MKNLKRTLMIAMLVVLVSVPISVSATTAECHVPRHTANTVYAIPGYYIYVYPNLMGGEIWEEGNDASGLQRTATSCSDESVVPADTFVKRF